MCKNKLYNNTYARVPTEVLRGHRRLLFWQQQGARTHGFDTAGRTGLGPEITPVEAPGIPFPYVLRILLGKLLDPELKKKPMTSMQCIHVNLYYINLGISFFPLIKRDDFVDDSIHLKPCF